MNLVIEIYSLTRALPKEELYRLTNQMRRAAVSIPSNIAEGQQRKTTKDFIKFLSIARGSNGELQTQLLICCRLGYLQQEQITAAFNLTREVFRMLNGLIATLERNVVN